MLWFWFMGIGLGFTELSFCGNPLSSIHSLSPYSPTRIPLQWSVNEVLPGATFTIFYRTMEKGTTAAWEKVAALEATSATSGIFDATHGDHLEFRSAVSSPQGSDMVILGDFDNQKIQEGYYISPDSKRLSSACSIGGFERTVLVQSEDAAQGNGCFQFTFSSNIKDKSEIPPGSLIGLRFDSTIPARDWSAYRYLELFYRGNIPQGVDLWIETSRVGIMIPLLRFSLDGGSLNEWHSILVDLDDILGNSELRQEIHTVAFIKRIRDLDLSEEYEMQLDAIRLWSDRRFVQTSVDGTAPSAPENLQYEFKFNQIAWNWAPSRDPESDIAGYAYLFTQDRRKSMPKEIMTATATVQIPFIKPSSYQQYYFFVSACNKAGLWSPVMEKEFSFTP